MPIGTIANSESSASARSKINLALAAVDALGNAATKNTGTTAGTVCAGDDSRLSNARTPTAHGHTTADLPVASQAEAEAGSATDKLMTPQRTAQAIAALAGGGGGSISTPRVLHVTTDGNDTTGDGSFVNPYLTAQKAFDEAFGDTGHFVICLGVGSFGNVNCPSGWPDRISLHGLGFSASQLNTVTLGANSVLAGDGVHISTVNGSGAPGTEASGENEPGGNGVEGKSCTIEGLKVHTCLLTGGDGGPGGPGGDQGYGATGGNLTLVCATVYAVLSVAGGYGHITQAPNGSITASRSTYPSGTSITTDKGGNSAW